jgi:hypothetical protein
MRLLFHTAACLLFIVLLFSSCNKKTSTTLSPTAVDSLKSVFQDINRDLEATWDEMIQDDNDKLDNMRRILQEVEYSGSYNRLKLDSLKKNIDQLAEARYDQQTMSDSELINLYDSMTNQVMGEVTVFTTQLEQFEQYPIMGQLLQEVFEADDRVLHHRIQYDRLAKAYNSFIETHEPDMKALARQSNLQPKPLFELQN